MRILIAGASGMIGSAVSPYLSGQGHEVVRLVRWEAEAGQVSWDPEVGTIDTAGLEGFDGVVQLASMPWPVRWTPKFKKVMLESRVACNRLLAESLAGCQHRPQVLVCASGMGYYPSRGDQEITEDSPPGTSFLASLQVAGEGATAPASQAGIRVVHLRIPAVLDRTTIQRSALPSGSGRQWMSWVGRDELARIAEHALLTPALVGGVNASSPNPLRNADFMATRARMFGRKPGPRIPAFILHWMLGEMAGELILASRRMQPCKLLATGFEFRFPLLEDTIRHELGLTV
jgi:hypothetical protein